MNEGLSSEGEGNSFVLFCLAALRGFWDLSSPTRDGTWALGSESTESNHWTAGEFLGNSSAVEAL